MMKKTLTLICLAFTGFKAIPQNLVNYPYAGHTTYDHVTEAIPLTSEYLCAANAYDAGNLPYAIEIFRSDDHGVISWKKSYTPVKFAATIRCTDIVYNPLMKEFALVGYYLNENNNQHKIFLLSVDENGAIKHSATIDKLDGKNENYYPMKIETSDGGNTYVLGGYEQQHRYDQMAANSSRNGFVLKCTADLQGMKWQTFITSSNLQLVYDMDAVSDIKTYQHKGREYYLVGGSFNNNTGAQINNVVQEALLVQLDDAGQIVWEANYALGNNYHSVTRILCDEQEQLIYVLSNSSQHHTFAISAFNLIGNHLATRFFHPKNKGVTNPAGLDMKFSCDRKTLLVAGLVYHVPVASGTPIVDGGVFNGGLGSFPFLCAIETAALFGTIYTHNPFVYKYNPKLLSDIQLFTPENSHIMAYAGTNIQHPIFYKPEMLVNSMLNPTQFMFPAFSDEFKFDEEKLNLVTAAAGIPHCYDLQMATCFADTLFETISKVPQMSSVKFAYYFDEPLTEVQFDEGKLVTDAPQFLCPASKLAHKASRNPATLDVAVNYRTVQLALKTGSLPLATSQLYEVQITNVMGQVIYAETVNAFPLQLSRSLLGEGVLFITVRGKGVQVSEKIMIHN